MRINADFSERVVVRAATLPWVASPMAGVDRKMLDRIGEEVARATSLVRYAPGSAFSPHIHGGGEEFIVLEGVFSDEHGDFPAGSYIRNPPTSSHTPRSEPGTVIFVKLHQFDPDDRTQIRMQIDDVEAIAASDRPGVRLRPLFSDGREDVRVEEWEAGARITLTVPGGGEFLVLEGSFQEGSQSQERHDWLRLPPGGVLDAVSGPEGARVWVKTGHLAGLAL